MQFEKAIQALCSNGVEFVVIGGLSATLHGSARVTYDLDVCYARTSQNTTKLAAALAPFHPRLRGAPAGVALVWDERTLRTATLLTLQTDLGAIDLLAEVAGFSDYEEILLHSMAVTAFDRSILTLDLPGLIHAKRAAGREKDLLALKELESILEASEKED